MNVKRIKYIDGLRGIAILSVVFFHAYVNAPEHLPFGNAYGYAPLRFGWAGVQLFFLISGFVILMTLENCASLAEFAIRRWLRLFPAMLVASALILTFDSVCRLGPHADRSLADAIPGLLFINPALIHAVTRIHLESLDGAFWTLYVEAAFYAVFGCSYVWFGAKRAIILIAMLAFISGVCMALTSDILRPVTAFERSAAAMHWMGFTDFGWFAAGALFFRFRQRNEPRYLLLAIATGILSSVLSGTGRMGLADHLAMVAVIPIFVAPLLSPAIERFFANHVLVFFGFVSYPLYLIHDNMLVGLEGGLAAAFPGMPKVLAPLPPIILLTCTAWTIARFAEPWLRTSLIGLHQTLTGQRREIA